MTTDTLIKVENLCKDFGENKVLQGINLEIKKGDVVVIAGKGSENYQEILGIKRPYNDKDTVEEILWSSKD